MGNEKRTLDRGGAFPVKAGRRLRKLTGLREGEIARNEHGRREGARPEKPASVAPAASRRPYSHSIVAGGFDVTS